MSTSQTPDSNSPAVSGVADGSRIDPSSHSAADGGGSTDEGAIEAKLGPLRAEIDQIDNGIQDLLIRRTELVDQIKAAKRPLKGGVLRPGREASVLRRLMARASGPFPKPVLLRIWREIFSALVTLQDRLTLAVWMPERGAGYLEVARTQYGTQTPATAHRSTAQVVQEIMDDRATVGILPIPTSESETAWWTALGAQVDGTPRIVARLPYWASRDDLPAAFAIAKLSADPSDGPDRSVLIVEASASMSRGTLLDSLRKADLVPVVVMDSRPITEDERVHLIDVEGYVAPQDVRLSDLERGSDGRVQFAISVGSYAVPLDQSALSAAPAGEASS